MPHHDTDAYQMPMSSTRRLGKEVHKARIDKDLTRQALADLADIACVELAAIERGEIDPRWSTVVKLSIALEPYLMLDMVAWNTHREEQGILEEDARHG